MVLEDSKRARTALHMLKNINRLTIHRHMLKGIAFRAFSDMLKAIAGGMVFEAECHYHRLTAELLKSNIRRVTGSLFADYILHSIIEVPNDFSSLAARGFLDEAIYTAATADLNILLPLTSLDTPFIMSLLEQPPGYKPEKESDKIALMADAAWGGVQVRRTAPQYDSAAEAFQTPIQQHVRTAECLSWKYGDFELRGIYTSDTALEEIYMRCMSSERSGITEDLWNFFNSYGTGVFLKSRAFEYTSRGFFELPQGVYQVLEPPYLCESARSRVVDSVIAFMRDDNRQNILVTGGSGIGKTAMALSLLEELPELRLICLDSRTASSLMKPLMDELRCQPLKFILFIDDADNAVDDINMGLMSGAAQPENVLVYCTAREAASVSARNSFPVHIALEYPTLNEFAKLIHTLLQRKGLDMEFSAIHNACMDYQLETHMPLSYAAANTITNELVKSNSQW